MNQVFIASNKHTLMLPKTLTADHDMENVEPQDYTTSLLVLGVWEDSNWHQILSSLLRVTGFLLAPLMVSKNLFEKASDAGTISWKLNRHCCQYLVVAQENLMSHTQAGVT